MIDREPLSLIATDVDTAGRFLVRREVVLNSGYRIILLQAQNRRLMIGLLRTPTEDGRAAHATATAYVERDSIEQLVASGAVLRYEDATIEPQGELVFVVISDGLIGWTTRRSLEHEIEQFLAEVDGKRRDHRRAAADSAWLRLQVKTGRIG
jgi:hypothetical protein